MTDLFDVSDANAIIEMIPLPLMAVCSDMNIRFANLAFREWFQQGTLADLPKKIWDCPGLIQRIKSAIERGVAFRHFEQEINCSRLGLRTLKMDIRRCSLLNSAMDCALLTFDDVTERRRTERRAKKFEQNRTAMERQARDEAEQSNTLKDLFLATLSHELRTPLTSILSWSQMIPRVSMDREKINYAAGVIEQNALIQGQLIDDLLDLARIQSGKFALNLSEVDPVEVVKASIQTVRLLGTRKSISVRSHFGENIPGVFVDPSRLQQIVWNLLTNSIKFSPENSVIDVWVEHVAPDVYIRVIDRGKGISAEFLPKVFKRFSQADCSSVRVHAGLGLGLSLVSDLVKIQHGTVTAESAGEGQGATFTVCFPAIKDGSGYLRSMQSQALKQDTDLSGIKILLVDDEPDLLEAVSNSLRSFGATVECASSAMEAWNQFNHHVPDVLVSDIAMPLEDGYSLIRKIRHLNKRKGGRVPAIAFTAYASKEDMDRVLSAGFQRHIAKPVKALFLAASVADLVKSSSLSGLN